VTIQNQTTAFLLLFFLFTIGLFAQEMAVVDGYIKSEDGEFLEGATIYNSASQTGDVSDDRGYYKLEVEKGKKITLRYSYFGFQEEVRVIKFAANNSKKRISVTLKKMVQDVGTEIIIRDKVSTKAPPIVKLEPKDFITLPSTGNAVIDLVKLLPSASSNNELSSQYSVRGGNYDENIITVNDFEIFRPFLVRNGQQEGLSFINPDMVRSVNFSAGGFEAKYGDKMSSVLDVKYRRPNQYAGSVQLGLLGLSAHAEGISKNKDLRFILGYRQKSNKYLLNALPTSGQYQPVARDFQAFLTYQLTGEWELQWISNYSLNSFTFFPEAERIRFGNIAETKEVAAFFEGQETDNYKSLMSGVGATYLNEDKKLSLKFQASGYRSVEEENFNIIGEYFIGEVEGDLGQENFGQVVSQYGIGTFHDFARNDLDVTILNLAHKGNKQKNNHFLSWGVKYQHESINDEINEWNRIDSAGYSLEYSDAQVNLSSVLKTTLGLKSNRFTAYVQDSWDIGDSSRMNLNAGVRLGYWDVNGEAYVNPRVSLLYRPRLATMKDREMILRLSTGLYYQPPFYRELRDENGTLNKDLKSQKSLHVVGGMEYFFPMWGRPFKFSTEAYYKHLWDLVPYRLDNVLIRYNAKNNSKGYATGVEFRINGEFVKGAESWFGIGLLQTKEDILDDFYISYFDADGTEVEASSSQIVDTVRVEPGYIPRPTDQTINFNIFFQDNLANNENIKAHLSLQFGTGIPFGPPDQVRNRNAFRSSFYRRVDVGFSALLFDAKGKELSETSQLRWFQSIWASLEVFNLLGISNTISYTWIDDFQGRKFSIPNRSTARRISARIMFKF